MYVVSKINDDDDDDELFKITFRAQRVPYTP